MGSVVDLKWCGCNEKFASAPATVAGGATGTLTFTVANLLSYRFKPIGIQFIACDPAAPATLNAARHFRATAITYLGTNYLLNGTNGLNLGSYSPETFQAFSLMGLPTLMLNGANLTVTIANFTTATSLIMDAWLCGWSDRRVSLGGCDPADAGGSAIVP